VRGESVFLVILDFLENPELSLIFEGKKTPQYLVEQIEISLDVEFNQRKEEIDRIITKALLKLKKWTIAGNHRKNSSTIS